MDREMPERQAGPRGPADIFVGYADEPFPLGGYAGLLGLYLAGFSGLAWLTRAQGQRLPERASVSDVVLLGVATHKVARLVTKDWVTSPLRAPFTTYVGSLGGGEVEESARGTGFRKALGDLFT